MKGPLFKYYLMFDVNVHIMYEMQWQTSLSEEIANEINNRQNKYQQNIGMNALKYPWNGRFFGIFHAFANLKAVPIFHIT